MIVALLAASALTLLPAEERTELARCGVNDAEAGRLLALNWEDFDQDHTPGGWRAIAAKPNCFGAAAAMIELYLVASTAVPQPDSHEASSLRWHAGQMHAFAGDPEAAIALFRGTYDPPGTAAEAEEGVSWNAYVDATVAFLERNRPALEAAHKRLAAQPIPEEMAAERKAELATKPGADLPPLSPPHLDVVDRLLTCFGSSYSIAFRGQCVSAQRQRAN